MRSTAASNRLAPGSGGRSARSPHLRDVLGDRGVAKQDVLVNPPGGGSAADHDPQGDEEEEKLLDTERVPWAFFERRNEGVAGRPRRLKSKRLMPWDFAIMSTVNLNRLAFPGVVYALNDGAHGDCRRRTVVASSLPQTSSTGSCTTSSVTSVSRKEEAVLREWRSGSGFPSATRRTCAPRGRSRRNREIPQLTIRAEEQRLVRPQCGPGARGRS